MVEDEGSLREVTREYFGNNGYTVLVVLEPGAAMEAAANASVFHVSKRPQMKTATAFPQ